MAVIATFLGLVFLVVATSTEQILCKQLTSLPVLCSFENTPIDGSRILAIFVDEAVTPTQFEKLQVMAAKKVLPDAVAVMALGPSLPPLVAASALLSTGITHVVALGETSSTRAAAAALALLAYKRQTHSPDVANCQSARHLIIYTDSTSSARFKTWVIPMVVAGHWTEARSPVLAPSLLFVNVTTGFAAIELFSEFLPKVVTGEPPQNISIPGDCQEVPAALGPSLYPFAEVAAYIADLAAQTVVQGESSNIAKAAEWLVCLSDIKSPNAPPMTNTFVTNQQLTSFLPPTAVQPCPPCLCPTAPAAAAAAGTANKPEAWAPPQQDVTTSPFGITPTLVKQFFTTIIPVVWNCTVTVFLVIVSWSSWVIVAVFELLWPMTTTKLLILSIIVLVVLLMTVITILLCKMSVPESYISRMENDVIERQQNLENTTNSASAISSGTAGSVLGSAVGAGGESSKKLDDACPTW